MASCLDKVEGMNKTLSTGLNTYLTMELSIKASGSESLAMAMVSRSGLMELNMKATGRTIKQKVKVSFGMLMATCSTASGKRTKLTAMESTLMSTELSMRESGNMICSMVVAERYGLTVAATMVFMKKA